jgi:hypothetical protein
MRNVSDKIVAKNQKHALQVQFFPPENRSIYEIMWKNIVQPIRPQMTSYGAAQKSAICMPGNYGKNTDTPSQFLIFIAFPWQKGVHERT